MSKVVETLVEGAERQLQSAVTSMFVTRRMLQGLSICCNRSPEDDHHVAGDDA
jgi:hypothetical protein